MIYDKHGNIVELLLQRKVEDWNLLGWYEGKNPEHVMRSDLTLSDLSIEMLEAVITSADFHCQGCLLGPVLVPVGRNRLNATSSGTSSQKKKQ